jgi:hypothetical protein
MMISSWGNWMFAAGIIWGWTALNRITPQVFLVLPIVGWFIYFCIKVMISGFIGIPIAIYKTVQFNKEKQQMEELKRQMDSPCPKPIHPMPEGEGFLG